MTRCHLGTDPIGADARVRSTTSGFAPEEQGTTERSDAPARI
ncbi:hypothetical protein JNUCC64_01730 [Streptomyces sp. JNUCC 64]